MTTRRKLTPEELADAKRLKDLFNQAKSRYALEGRKLTQEKLAWELGWSGQTAVSQYTNANIPLNFDAVSKFANFFNVPIKDISPRLAAKLPDGNIGTSNTSSAPDAQGRIPLISWVKAGAWQEVEGSYQEDDAEGWVLCDVRHSSKSFALRVSGESMHNPGDRKSFDDGDIIYVDPERPVDNKSLVVVQINGDTEATFKQLILEGGRKYLKALNPNWPQQIMEMPEDSVVAGVVIGKRVSYID